MIDGTRIKPIGLPPKTEFPVKVQDIRAEKASKAPPFSEVLKKGILTVNQLQS